MCIQCYAFKTKITNLHQQILHQHYYLSLVSSVNSVHRSAASACCNPKTGPHTHSHTICHSHSHVIIPIPINSPKAPMGFLFLWELSHFYGNSSLSRITSHVDTVNVIRWVQLGWLRRCKWSFVYEVITTSAIDQRGELDSASWDSHCWTYVEWDNLHAVIVLLSRIITIINILSDVAANLNSENIVMFV